MAQGMTKPRKWRRGLGQGGRKAVATHATREDGNVGKARQAVQPLHNRQGDGARKEEDHLGLRLRKPALLNLSLSQLVKRFQKFYYGGEHGRRRSRRMMEKQPAQSLPLSSATNSRRRSDIITIIKSAACLTTTTSSADTGKGRSKLSSKVKHGFHLVEGRSRHGMEDYHVAEYRYANSHELGLFAIFDGHLGDAVPSYLKHNLFDNILKEPTFWTNPDAAIRNAYHLTNKVILENSICLGPGGSTAVTAIMVDGKDLWVANVGDSRAVLCERGSANQLTVDHEPDAERNKIEQKGGFVTIFPGDVPRVNGQLAVARAFGDQKLKAHLSSEPDVRHVPIDITMDFVILASDGLWKVMKNQEAVDLVKSIKDPPGRREASDRRGPGKEEQGRHLVYSHSLPWLEMLLAVGIFFHLRLQNTQFQLKFYDSYLFEQNLQIHHKCYGSWRATLVQQWRRL